MAVLQENMPQFDVNDDDTVLVKFESGKKYYSQLPQKQEAQKGDTCSYYAPGKIRIRAGKIFDELKNNYRECEKLISQYRKLSTDITATRKIEQELLSSLVDIPGCKNKIIDKSLVQNIVLPFFRQAKIATKSTDFDNIIIACDAFLKSQFPTFQEFVAFAKDEKNYSMTMIRNCIGTLEGLARSGVKVDEIKTQELALRRIDKIESLPLPEQRAVYHNIFRHVAWDCFGFKSSAWEPAKGIDGLMSALRHEGPMIVSGRFGAPSYNVAPHPFEPEDFKNIGSCKILGWKPDEFKIGNDLIHEIVIVGAKKIKGKDFVFFLDPQLPSIPGEERAVVMMSYDRLLKGLGNIYGQRFVPNRNTNDTVLQNTPGPFAICADQDKMKEISVLLDKSISELTTTSGLSFKSDQQSATTAAAAVAVASPSEKPVKK